LERTRNKQGADHPDTLNRMNNLATAYRGAGQLEKALPLLRQTIELMQGKLGADHPTTLTATVNLAAALWSDRQFEQAIPLLETAIPMLEAKFARDHRQTVLAIGYLGVNYRDVGRVDEAIPLLEEARGARDKIPTVRWVGTALLEAYGKADRDQDATRLAEELVAECRTRANDDGLGLAKELGGIGSALVQGGRFTEAEPLLRESLAIRQRHKPNAWPTYHCQSLLGAALLGQGRNADAEPLLFAGTQGMERNLPNMNPLEQATLYRDSLARLCDFLESTGRGGEAANWRSKLEPLGR
jgi:tetratricopeptide (TPR) repeat protein